MSLAPAIIALSLQSDNGKPWDLGRLGSRSIIMFLSPAIAA
jgi:hypothetical protein